MEFKLAYYNVKVQRVSYLVMVTPLLYEWDISIWNKQIFDKRTLWMRTLGNWRRHLYTTEENGGSVKKCETIERDKHKDKCFFLLIKIWKEQCMYFSKPFYLDQDVTLGQLKKIKEGLISWVINHSYSVQNTFIHLRCKNYLYNHSYCVKLQNLSDP